MIHVIIGTRAQVIKMAPVMKELDSRGINYNFIFLAQHKETIYEIIDQFEIKKPDIVIGDINRDITNVKDMIIWSLRVIKYTIANHSKIFKNDKKGVVLIHGDAPPLFLGSLMAKIHGCEMKVAQIEAGLRSFNFLKPFPEELIRVISAKVGLIDIFFCQDEQAINNVSRYNKIAHSTKHNTILDSIRIATKSNLKRGKNNSLKTFAIASIHRFETITKKENLTKVIKELQKVTKMIKLLFILHPPTRISLKKYGLYKNLEEDPNCELLQRQDFFHFNNLLKSAEFVITDGGSNQEECFYMGIPCLLLRSETERIEGLGHNVVISNFDSVIIDNFVRNYRLYRREPISKKTSPSKIIIDHLKEFT